MIATVKKDKADFEQKLSEAHLVNANLKEKIQVLESEKNIPEGSPSKTEKKKE